MEKEEKIKIIKSIFEDNQLEKEFFDFLELKLPQDAEEIYDLIHNVVDMSGTVLILLEDSYVRQKIEEFCQVKSLHFVNFIGKNKITLTKNEE